MKRDVRGSDARHTTTAQYYRNIKRETERLQNGMKLLQSDIEEAERLLEQTKSEINTEKLQAAKTEAKTTLVSKIGSLLGSGKLREVEQNNKKLCELVTDREQYIDELYEKILRMENSHSRQLGEVQQKHQSEVMELKSKHTTDVSFLNGIICKAKQWFPRLEALLQIENLCRKIGFTTEQTELLLTGKALNFSGSLYSDEHRKKFIVENAEIKVFSTSAKPNQLILVQGTMGQLEKQNLHKGTKVWHMNGITILVLPLFFTNLMVCTKNNLNSKNLIRKFAYYH